MADLQESVEHLIADSGAESVSVALQRLGEEPLLLINPDVSYHAASTMKICVMMELFRQVHEGKRSLDDQAPIANEFSSLADGSPFSLNAEDDSEPSLYARLGENATLMHLCELMITVSSNLATNILIGQLGIPNVQGFMLELGAPGLQIKRGVEDKKAYRLGMNSEVTARGLLTILDLLGRGLAVSPAASESMVNIMLRQQHRNCIPALLPPEVQVANKVGWNSGICHDAGIVYPPDGHPYALVVLTKGLDEEAIAPRLISEISSHLYRLLSA